MNLKAVVQATEITEDTEMMRAPHFFNVYPMGERIIDGNLLFFSVNSVSFVANCFFRLNNPP